MSKLRAIVFDFDGVILESANVKTEAFVALYSSYGSEIVERVRHGARENRPAHARREQPVPVFGPRAGGVGVDEGQDA